MKRGQISIDFLFAVVLVSLTLLGLIVSGVSQAKEVSLLGKGAQLKVFAVDVRDSVSQVYASGPGIVVVKAPPFPLTGDDWINVTLNTNQTLVITAQLDGKHYLVIQRLQVPIKIQSSVLLTPNNDTFRIVSSKLVDGGILIAVSK